MQKKDILIFLSDQHNGRIMGCAGDNVVRTPHLDNLAANGTLFQNTYTSCPLCVPARMSFLTGRLPCHTGVFTNKGSIPPEMPTFLHQLAIAGYETVLCGRMHFEGEDQRHGFTKRIAGDITPTAMGPTDNAHDRGPYSLTTGEPFCLQIIGGGNSPIQEYDRYVVEAARNYLSQPHQKPQCLVVGTYAPHFPYVAPQELYDYYYDKATIPPTVQTGPGGVHPAERKRMSDCDPQIVRAVRAAYYGLVEFEDQCIGQVRTAWDAYLQNNNRQGIFLYLSDHGDHAGSHGFYGKQSLYDDVLRVPLVVCGDGVQKNRTIHSPVSIMDIGPTLCEMAGIDAPPAQDGISLWNTLLNGDEPESRDILAEWINDPFTKGTEYGRMLRRGPWKLISYFDYPENDLLLCPENDPWETNSLSLQEPEILQQLRESAFDGIDPQEIVAKKNLREDDCGIIAKFNRLNGMTNPETWQCSQESKRFPKAFIQSNKPLHPYIQIMWDRQMEAAKKEGLYNE
ncbi:MAG: sulfatase-like hydrolase/transferase [Faecousia sp.]